MVRREFWLDWIEKQWSRKPVLWMSGVRRAGKTSLCQSIPDIVAYDCELPSIRRMLADPEAFLTAHKSKRILLDEIHRLENPSEILKLAADHFPGTRIIATGSSILGTSSKFKDTLAGRKSEIWLTPMLTTDLVGFGNSSLEHRMLRGGLPPFFLDDIIPEREYQEWMDAFWAKDIQELFRLERRHSFQKFTELLLAQSGGMFEAAAFAKPCEVSRGTITNYLAVLEATFVAHVVRPFSKHKATEIVSAPKVYAFDTGFMAFQRGWTSLRPEDLGTLWEHLVLNEMHGRWQRRDIHYWRDKARREVDFVLTGRGRDPVAIECKWSADRFEADGIAAFRKIHPQGANYVVANGVAEPYEKEMGGNRIRFVGLEALIKEAVAEAPPGKRSTRQAT
jgi:predicted AAA+ superfamily ATPase